MTNESPDPVSACDDCGASSIEFPEWMGDQTLITCRVCGKPIGTVQFIVDILRAALIDNENYPLEHERSEEIRTPRRLLN